MRRDVSASRPDAGLYLTFVAVATVMGITSHYMATPLVPLAAVHVGADTAGVGLVTGIYGLLPLLLAVPIGLLADRVGPGKVAAAGTGLLAATTLGLLAPSLAGLAAAQALRGLGQVSLMIGMQGFIAALLPAGRGRQTAYGSYVMAVALGQTAGPIVGGWLTDRGGLSFTFVVAALLAFAAAFVCIVPALGDRRAPSEPAAAGGLAVMSRSVSLLRERPVQGAVAASCCVLLMVAIGISFYPLFLARAGVPVTTIGLLVAMRGASAALGRPLLPALLRRTDRWGLLRLSLLASCLATAATPLSLNLGVQAALSFFVGLGMGVGQPLTMAVVADHAGLERGSEALSLRVGANRLLQFVGPLLLGLIGERTGLAGTFIVGGLLPLAALWPLRGLSDRRRPAASQAGTAD